ncbi:MAG: hypothetical protein KBC66_02105 [Kiritimatiellae bacterium]|jgi:hypothetical protein|nr:hypothetical protein [Kiritimatiellia bacterium]NLD89887.1 hypothetical protein [Lentisphaerota bacterium]HPC18939.1 hypothetical protein [Kiritimatiellia bacterium]HQN80357.1 hypothetical protein [Kiritimatiellia bacterium]
MTEPLVNKVDFRVDTRRHRSRSKMRSKIRHMLAVAAAMFPLMAAFVFIRALFLIPEHRRGLYQLAIVFLACGMVSLMAYAWARSEKLRRHEVSARNRELKYRRREERFRQETARRAVLPAQAAAKED